MMVKRGNVARPIIPAIVYAGGGTIFREVMIGLPTTKNTKGRNETPTKARKRRKNVKFARRSCFSFCMVRAFAPSLLGSTLFKLTNLLLIVFALQKSAKYKSRDTTLQALERATEVEL